MDINGKIIEGDYSKYNEFVELYNNYDINVLEIKRIVGHNIYTKLRREALINGDIKPRPFNLRHNKNYKYYHFDKGSGKYRVRKVKNGKYMSFGFFDTEDEAKDMVRRLKEVDWDKNKLK